MKAALANTASILVSTFAATSGTGINTTPPLTAAFSTTAVAYQQNAQQPQQRVERLPQIVIPPEVKFINTETGRNLNLPEGTRIIVPKSLGNRVLELSTSGENKVTATFIMPDANGEFTLPPGVVLAAPTTREDGRRSLSRLPYDHTNTAFKVKDGTDFLHVIPTIDFYPGQRGMIFEIDANNLRPDPQEQEQGSGRFMHSPTLAFAYQYDWPGDFGNLTPKLVQEILASREDYTLVRESDGANNSTMGHILTSHLRDGDIKIPNYGATQINLAGRFGDMLLVSRERELQNERQGQEPSSP